MRNLSNEQLQAIIIKGQWHLTDEEELLRIDSAQDFTDPHPLTDAVIDIAERLPSPCTVAQIIKRLYESSDPTKDSTRYLDKSTKHPDKSTKHLDKSTRQNQAIISDILQSNGFVYARRKLPYSEERIRGWWKGLIV